MVGLYVLFLYFTNYLKHIIVRKITARKKGNQFTSTYLGISSHEGNELLVKECLSILIKNMTLVEIQSIFEVKIVDPRNIEYRNRSYWGRLTDQERSLINKLRQEDQIQVEISKTI